METPNTLPNTLKRAWPPLAGMALALMAYWGIYILAPAFHAVRIQGEDRAVEWITFAGFFVAGILALSFLRHRHLGWKHGWLYLAGVGLFFLLCAGEEISWGQRIFGFATPQKIAELNEQGEFNLHNLRFEHLHPKDIALTLIKIFGIGLPLVFIRRMRNPADPAYLYVPPLFLVPSFLFADLVGLFEEQIGQTAARLADPKTAAFILEHLGALTEELQELFIAIAVFLALCAMSRAWKNRRSGEA